MGKMNNLKKKRLMRRNMVGYSFIAPNFIGFAVFTMMPMLFSFGLSFCEWDSSHPIQFVGLQNFIGLLSDDTHMWRHWLQSALSGICCLTRIWVQSTVS